MRRPALDKEAALDAMACYPSARSEREGCVHGADIHRSGCGERLFCVEGAGGDTGRSQEATKELGQ